MDFFKYKCPVCDEQFKKGDDIVVCPECGTPHHRECYDEKGKCFYDDKHSEDFSFDEVLNENNENESVENDENQNNENVICPACGSENHKTMFFCTKCGYPINTQDKNKQDNNNSENADKNTDQNFPPFGMPFDGNVQQINMVFDPMAGLKNEDNIGENVTAGECAKFVGKNTPYFLRVFNNIKKFSNSRFNFSAAIFSGTYFLYRKMYLIGCIITAIVLALNVFSTFIMLTPAFAEITAVVEENAVNYSTMSLYTFDMNSHLFDGLSQADKLLYFAPSALIFLDYIIMFTCGFTANRLYYKHCIKKVNKIKNNTDKADLNQALESKGGVNIAIAICVELAFLIITELPNILRFFELL